MKRFFGFKYQKTIALLLTIFVAYLFFSSGYSAPFVSAFNQAGYLGAFIAGAMFTFGFTTPFATGFFILMKPDNILLYGVIGGFGALLFDLIIFNFIRFTLMDEFKEAKKGKDVKFMAHLVNKTFSHKLRNYLLYAVAGLIIASPLPDELGIIMLAGLSHIKQKKLAVISFVFNTLGILFMLSL